MPSCLLHQRTAFQPSAFFDLLFEDLSGSFDNSERKGRFMLPVSYRFSKTGGKSQMAADNIKTGMMPSA